MKISITRKQQMAAASVLLMLIAWKLLSLAAGSNYILPSPEATFKSLILLFADIKFWGVVGATILRGLAGFAIATIAGIALGIPAGLNPDFRAFLNPPLVFIRSIPVVAFILMALIWFSSSTVPVFIGMLTMFPLICTNVIEGMKNTDPQLVQMAHFYKIKKLRIVRDVYIPSLTPFLMSGISSAVGIGWRAIIVGEVLSQPQWGIGSLMHQAQTFLNMDRLIAWTLLAVALSYAFEGLIRLWERKLTKWKEA